MKEDYKMSELFNPGYFFTGCNYWASHAGTNMWHDWRPDIIDSDLAKLEEADIRVMRMFPLWSDFQPLRMHRAYGSNEREIRLGEDPLPFTEAGRAGVDEEMADRFETFCDLAEKHHIRLIVGLITGWMSGRMHAPEAFAGRGLITDPMVVRWQVRFVRYMVRRFKDHPAVYAWDLGNECNCLQSVSRDEAFRWSTQIANAIRVEDDVHPIVSGMHSLLPNGAWTPEDQGEALDILCTHPYPIFTPHCETDPINEMKTILHSTAETVMYASLGNKPAFIEEAGTLGPMIADEETAGAYVRAAIFSAWAHGLYGFIWWCANEQSALTHTPYDWNSVERELGLFRIDGSKKPVLESMTAFTRFADSFAKDHGALPPRLTDAVCILTEGQDVWGAAYGSFILAKQAGLDISFAWALDEIPESKVYMLPSLCGDSAVEGHVLGDLLERVKRGATLYLSIDNALLSPFSSFTGVKVKTRSRRVKESFADVGGTVIHEWTQFKYLFESVGAKVIISDGDGEPVLTEYPLGDGKVCFCAWPIETDAASKPGAVSGDAAIPYYRFYEMLGLTNPAKCASCASPYIGLTEHIASDDARYLTIMNYRPNAESASITLNGYEPDEILTPFGGSCVRSGTGIEINLPADSGMVIGLKKLR